MRFVPTMNLKFHSSFSFLALKFTASGIASLLLFIICNKCFAADIVTLSAIVPSGGGTAYSTDSIELSSGDVAEILSSYSRYASDWSTVSLTINGREVVLPFLVAGSPGTNGSGSPSPTAISKWVVAGPATLRARANGSNWYSDEISFFTASITRAGAVPSQVPMGAVVIPENPSGSYSVIMESSSDMVTWTASNPGSYGGSEQKRFFRLRAEQITP